MTRIPSAGCASSAPHRTELEVTLQEGAEVLENVRRRACPSSSEVPTGNVKKRACSSSSEELLVNVRRKGEGANPSSSEDLG